MNKETAEVLKHVADKLDIPVEQLWAGMVAYAPFTFWQWVAGIGIGLLIAIAFGILCWWAARKGHDGTVFFGAMCVGAFAVTSVLSLADMSDALAAKYAPQAWAAKYIVRRLHR